VLKVDSHLRFAKLSLLTKVFHRRRVESAVAVTSSSHLFIASFSLEYFDAVYIMYLTAALALVTLEGEKHALVLHQDDGGQSGDESSSFPPVVVVALAVGALAAEAKAGVGRRVHVHD